jgi:transposase
VVTAPAELREQLRGRSAARLLRQAAGLQPGQLATPTAAAKLALPCLAERSQVLSAEVATLDTELDRLTAKAAPGLVARFGSARPRRRAAVAAGDNPDRLRTDAAFSMPCGASPIPASSGRTIRHRLNRGGDRQANAALHRIVVVRLRWHQPTRDSMARRLTEGKSKAEILRCFIGGVSVV